MNKPDFDASTARKQLAGVLRSARALRFSFTAQGRARRGRLAGVLRFAIDMRMSAERAPNAQCPVPARESSHAATASRPYVVTYEDRLPPVWDDGATDGLGY
jgi:hypothetical protein